MGITPFELLDYIVLNKEQLKIQLHDVTNLYKQLKYNDLYFLDELIKQYKNIIKRVIINDVTKNVTTTTTEDVLIAIEQLTIEKLIEEVLFETKVF